jgi:hypothetical protein
LISASASLRLMMQLWKFAAPLATLAILLVEHFLPHGKDLNPVHHWLSEYVLSDSPLGVALMHAAFVGLAATAVAVMTLPVSRGNRALFGIGGAALFGMTFFDTEPNGIPITHMTWPPTPSQVHKLLLYVALATVLLGMALHSHDQTKPKRSPMLALFGIAAVATAVQTYLIAVSKSQEQPTQFGGITERVVVLATLAWACLCFSTTERRPEPKASNRERRHPAGQRAEGESGEPN